MITKVPRYTEFSVKEIYENALKEDGIIAMYLPEHSAGRVISREFLFNIINTIDDSFFAKNIEKALKFRKEKHNQQNGTVIKWDATIYEELCSTSFFSKKKGRAVSMLCGNPTESKKRKLKDISNSGPLEQWDYSQKELDKDATNAINMLKQQANSHLE
jgi:hypothetical protein